METDPGSGALAPKGARLVRDDSFKGINMTAFEIEEVKTRSVDCAGGKGDEGHPHVYLKIGPTETETTCPYCSKGFVLRKAS